MTKTYTLKELADIGARAAQEELPRTCFEMIVGLIVRYPEHAKAREAFAQAILDAIGYELPKDEEREAFEVWWKDNKIAYVNEDDAFKAWKAGREELRLAINKPSYSMPPSYAGITLLGTKPNEPEWIPWSGGECPLLNTVKTWEYKIRAGEQFWTRAKPSAYRWRHMNAEHDIIAYRVLE